MEKMQFYLLWVILVGLYHETSCYGNKTNKGIIIKLFRQKTPREQYLNAPDLRKHGIHFDWLYKKPNRTNDSIALYRYLDNEEEYVGINDDHYIGCKIVLNEFYGKVVVGHPGQTMNVAFDTAWHLTWLISADCTDLRTVGCWFHNKYDHSKSSEYKPNGTKYEENAGKFNFTGYYSYENISIAHSNVTAFSFVEMTKVPFSFLFNKADGVLGLALRDEEGSYNPFFYTLLQQKKISKSIFSIYLNRDTQSNHGGNIMLGFYDKKHIHQTRYPNNSVIPDEITYLNVDPGQYWQFHIDSVLITKDKNNYTVLCSKGCKGIIDSSSNTIQGPADQVKKIHTEIKARELFLNKWMVDCETVNKLPKIDFILDGKTFRLSGKEYTTKISIYAFTLCLSAFSPMDSTGDEQIWVLGGAFLAEFYTIYDINKKQIGFVKAA